MANSDRSVFPLLQLPKRAQKTVCRLMDPLRQLTLSTCHEVTKNLVKSSGLKCRQFEVFSGFIRIKFNDQRTSFLRFIPNDEHPSSTYIRATYMRASSDNDWKLPLFTVRDWVKHLLWVLNRENIDYLRCERSTLEFFEQNFVGFSLNRLHMGGFQGIPPLIKNFRRLEHLELGSELPEVEFQKVLIQNLDSLEPGRDQKLTLDDLLLCNCAHFERLNDAMTPTDLNRFVKLWMKGSNPRMKYILVAFNSQDQILDKDRILRGINHQHQMEERTFIHVSDKELILHGGYEINRKDGTIATIMIERAHFEMFIWT